MTGPSRGDLGRRLQVVAVRGAKSEWNHVFGGYSRFRRYTPRMLRTLDSEASPAGRAPAGSGGRSAQPRPIGGGGGPVMSVYGNGGRDGSPREKMWEINIECRERLREGADREHLREGRVRERLPRREERTGNSTEYQTPSNHRYHRRRLREEADQERLREEERPREEADREEADRERTGNSTGYQTPSNRRRLHRRSPPAVEGAMTSDQIHEQHYKLLVAARRSVRYHMHRQRFLDRISKWGSALTAIFGSATVMSLLADQGEGDRSQYVAAATAVFAALELVFGPARSARYHNELAREFIALEQEALRVGSTSVTAESLLGLQIRRLDIEAKEPPVYRVLDVLCNDEVAKAFGHPEEHRSNVTWFQRLFKNIVDIRADRLEKKRRPGEPKTSGD